MKTAMSDLFTVQYITSDTLICLWHKLQIRWRDEEMRRLVVNLRQASGEIWRVKHYETGRGSNWDLYGRKKQLLVSGLLHWLVLTGYLTNTLSATVLQKIHGRIRKEIERLVVRSDAESEADDGKGEACAKWRYYGDRIAQSSERHLSIVRGLEAPRISTLQQHNSTMRFLRSLIPSLLLLGAGVAEAASSWNFDEAIISVTGKGNTAGAFKDKCVDSFIFRRGHLLIPIAQTLGSCSSCEARNIRLGRFP
jgi:hypothetical protein